MDATSEDRDFLSPDFLSPDSFSLASFSLAGSRALVTGGSTGLGLAFTTALAAAGADVFLAGLEEDTAAVGHLVERTGARVVSQLVDLTEPGRPQAVVEQCVSELGGLDILVNSAGVCLIDEVATFDRRQWDPMVAVNLTAAFELAHHAAVVMTAQGHGKIINIASLFSFLGGRGSPAYAATKAGIVGFTRAYCDELAGHGICVNALAPGYFKTAITENLRADPDNERRVVEHVPAGRWGDPADLMGPLVFLASPASDYVNGQVLVVDGGYLVR